MDAILFGRFLAYVVVMQPIWFYLAWAAWRGQFSGAPRGRALVAPYLFAALLSAVLVLVAEAIWGRKNEWVGVAAASTLPLFTSLLALYIADRRRIRAEREPTPPVQP